MGKACEFGSRRVACLLFVCIAMEFGMVVGIMVRFDHGLAAPFRLVGGSSYQSREMCREQHGSTELLVKAHNVTSSFIRHLVVGQPRVQSLREGYRGPVFGTGLTMV